MQKKTFICMLRRDGQTALPNFFSWFTDIGSNAIGSNVIGSDAIGLDAIRSSDIVSNDKL